MNLQTELRKVSETNKWFFEIIKQTNIEQVQEERDSANYQ